MPEYLESDPKIKATIKAISELGKTPADLVADYLRLLYEHIQAIIGQKFPGFGEQSGIETKCCLTVPAVRTHKCLEGSIADL